MTCAAGAVAGAGATGWNGAGHATPDFGSFGTTGR